MKTTDTIRVTSTSEASKQGDALGRGTAEDLEEADFVTLLYATLEQVAEHALEGAAPFGTRHTDALAIRAGAEALQRYMSSNPDMSLLGTFTTVHQLIADENDAGQLACPWCCERNIDALTIDEETDTIGCDTCGATYSQTGPGGSDTRPAWFRSRAGMTFRIYAPGGPYLAEGDPLAKAR